MTPSDATSLPTLTVDDFTQLAERVDLDVYYGHQQDAAGQGEAGFGVAFDWDVPLLGGYAHHFLPNVARHPGVSRFADCDTPTIGARLEGGRYDACLITGWYLKSYLQALLACRPSLTENPARLLVIDDHIAGRTAQAAAAAKKADAPVVLEARGLRKSFFLKEGLFGKREFQAVKGVSFQLRKGHTLGVVGESGSGKTTMGLTLLRLHEPTGGEVLFDGKDLSAWKNGDKWIVADGVATAAKGSPTRAR